MRTVRSRGEIRRAELRSAPSCEHCISQSGGSSRRVVIDCIDCDESYCVLCAELRHSHERRRQHRLLPFIAGRPPKAFNSAVNLNDCLPGCAAVITGSEEKKTNNILPASDLQSNFQLMRRCESLASTIHRLRSELASQADLNFVALGTISREVCVGTLSSNFPPQSPAAAPLYGSSPLLSRVVGSGMIPRKNSDVSIADSAYLRKRTIVSRGKNIQIDSQSAHIKAPENEATQAAEARINQDVDNLTELRVQNVSFRRAWREAAEEVKRLKFQVIFTICSTKI